MIPNSSCFNKGSQKSPEKSVVNVSGSASVIPLFQLLKDQFESSNSDIELRLLPYAHSRAGMEGVFIGDYDLGLISRELHEDEKTHGLRYIHLAEDLLVFATGSGIKIKNLTEKQIRDIYAGKISNWKQVGGPDEKIVVLDRPEHVSPKIALRKLLFGNRLKIKKDAIILEKPEDMETALLTIPNSIGYTSLGNSLIKGYNFNMIKINNVDPTILNLKNRIYPYSRPFGIVLKPNPERKVMKFVEFLFSNEGKAILERNAFLPITLSFIIGILPEQNLISQQLRYQPLADYLAKELGLGVNVSLRLLPSYRELLEALKTGEVTAGFFGSLIFAITKSQIPITPIARPEKNGVSNYRGLIFARKDSGINSVSDMEGKTLALVDKATTAGYLYPILYFKKHGINNINRFFKKVVFAGSHDFAILKVYNGEADVGAAKDLVFYKMDSSIQGALKIISMSPPVPENALAFNKNIKFTCYECHTQVKKGRAAKLDIEEKLKEIFLNMHKTTEGREILKSIGADYFILTRDSDYANVYRMLKESGMKVEDFLR